MYQPHRRVRSIFVLLGLLLVLTTSMVTPGVQRHIIYADGSLTFSATYEANDSIYCQASGLLRHTPLNVIVAGEGHSMIASSHGTLAQSIPAPRGVVAGTHEVDLVQPWPDGPIIYITTVFLLPSLALKRSTTDGDWFITGYRHDATQGILVTLTKSSDGTMQTLVTIAVQSKMPYSIVLHVPAPTLAAGMQYVLSAIDVATGYSGNVTFVAP